MNRLFIESTKGTPRVEFLPNGELSIQGRSLPENTYNFYVPLINWVNESQLDSINLEIRFEYMNTSSYKQIFTLLTSLKNNVFAKNVCVNWYFEEGDDDGYETGKEFESLLGLQFIFHEYEEVII